MKSIVSVIAGVSVGLVLADDSTSPLYVFPQDAGIIPDRDAPDRNSPPTGRKGLFKAAASKTVSRGYYDMRTVYNCTYPMEILILQDSTASFQDDLNEMIDSQLDLMMNGLKATHPGSKVNVVSFRDKPIHPFGEPGSKNVERDWCWKPLMNSTFTDDVNVLKQAYNSFDASGGDDFPEGHYYSIFGAMQSKKLGWGQVPNAAQLIVVSTDSAPHYEGDGNSMQNMSVFSGSFNDADPEQQCVDEFYPTPQQSIDVTFNPVYGATMLPYLAFLVFDGNYPKPNYTTNAWRWYANAIGEDAESFVNDLASDAGNFWSQLAEVIHEMDLATCTQTTPSPIPTTPTSTETSSVSSTGGASSESTTETSSSSTTEGVSSESTTRSNTPVVDPTISHSSAGTGIESSTSHLRGSTTGGCPPCPPCWEGGSCKCKCNDEGKLIVVMLPKDAVEAVIDVKY